VGVDEARAGSSASNLINELTPATENMQTNKATVTNIPFLTHFTMFGNGKAALSSPQRTKQPQSVPGLER
jgi:hypothetical protein